MKPPIDMKSLPLFAMIPLATMALANRGEAAVLLSVDFGINNTSVQAGYSGFGIGSGNTAGPISNSYTGLSPTETSGTVGITLSTGTTLIGTGNFTARDRAVPLMDSGMFTYSSVYRDFINTSTNGTLSVGLSGLNPNTAYNLTLYAYDDTNSRTMTFTDFTSGSAGASGSVSWTTGSTFDSTTPNSVHSVTLSVTSDASGNVIIRDVPTGSSPGLINGLQIASVPEPASAALGCGAGLLMLGLRRRRN